MPTLINYSGEDDLHSINRHMGIYCSPRKHSRINAPFFFSRDQSKKTPIEILPEECLFEIFTHLNSARERSSCACVSKQWLSLLSNMRKCETRNTNVIIETNPELESDGHLMRCLEGKKATDTRLAALSVGSGSHGGLEKLSIRGTNSRRGVTNLGLKAIARGCSSLKVLSLWNVPSVGDDGLIEIGNECNMLEKLDLCGCPSISNKGLIAIAKNCPNLNSLNIESCSNIGNESIQAIGQFCTKLKSISIKDCHLVGDHGVGNLLFALSSVLTNVKLHNLRITDYSLAVLGQYGKTISSLVLSGLQNVSEKGLWVMGNARGLRMLTHLTINSCRGITDVSLQAIGKGCQSMKHMCLHKCCFVSDLGLVAFVKSIDSLESLQLEECNRVTQTGVIGTLSNCGSKLKSLSVVKCMGIKDLNTISNSSCDSLRTLSIRNCPGFGNSSLAIVGKLCPHLQNVDLSGLCGITDAGLVELLDNSDSRLVKVNLSGCLNLTDKVVMSMARKHGTTLQLLNLNGCTNVTDASLLTIAENCLLLNDLDLSKCGITDSTVVALCGKENLNLRVLSLSGCSKISDKCIRFLHKMEKSLLGLNLQNCYSVSGKAVEALHDALWRCDILF